MQKAIDNNEWQTLFPGIRDLVKNADLSIVNFESTIAEIGDMPIDKIGSHIKTTYPSLFVLKQLGFDMITLANNHSLDYGENALYRTMNEATNLGLMTVGAGMNLEKAKDPKVLTLRGKKIAIINCCEHEFSIATQSNAGANPLDVIEISTQIRECKEIADFVVVIIHGGVEHYQLPTPRMKKVYRYFVGVGADAVVNHHQHCYSGYEYYNGKPIVYGIGNFCFDSASDRALRHETYNYGYFVKIIIDENGSVKVKTIPYEQCCDKLGCYLIKDADEFYNKIEKLNAIIQNDMILEDHFGRMAQSKNTYILGFMEPYVGRIMQGLSHCHLLPSFVTKDRMKFLSAKINCESHNEILKECLKQ